MGHDAAVAVVRDGIVLFAAEEERFSREKHTSNFPKLALEAARQTAAIQIRDVDAVAYPWMLTGKRFVHMNLNHAPRVPLRHGIGLAFAGLQVVRDLIMPGRISERFATDLRIPLPPGRGVRHHLGHSACAYFTSDFDGAAVLTVDGQGEDESGTLGEWIGTRYRHIHSIYSPNSIGILYGMVTDFLGMRAAWDEYKVMGMASYGDPSRFRGGFDRLVKLKPDGRYETVSTAMVFKPGYCDAMLSRVFGLKQRRRDEPLQQVHFDVAAALQDTTERVIFHLIHYLRRQTKMTKLCLAGGVFQNSVLNGKILRSGLFQNVHVPPVPGDHGGALGAALYVYHDQSGASRADTHHSAFLGPQYKDTEIQRVLDQHSLSIRYNKPDSTVTEAALLLASQKVIGWFQGRMEYGPRALGHRSILASPVSATMKDLVNDRIKHREAFRPFAGAVPLEHVREYILRWIAPPLTCNLWCR